MARLTATATATAMRSATPRAAAWPSGLAFRAYSALRSRPSNSSAQSSSQNRIPLARIRPVKQQPQDHPVVANSWNYGYNRNKNGSQKFSYFNGSEPFYKQRRFWIYLGIGSSLAAVYYVTHLETVPVSGRRRFMDLSRSEENMLSKQAYNEIMSQYGHLILSPSHPYSIYVRKVAEKIIRVSGLTDLDWEVHLIDYPQRNAFVLPGGKVFVFTGILPVCANEDGLAAVLGHEIAHQVARHSAEKMSWTKVAILAQILVSLFFDAGFLFNKLFLELGIMLPFSRQCESEADYIGLKLMAQACYNPQAAVSMWERMKSTDGGSCSSEYLSTHPTHSNRIVKINEWMPEAIETRNNADCSHLSPIFKIFKKSLGVGNGGRW